MIKKTKIPFMYNKVFPLLLVLATLFMGVGYASVNSITLSISGNSVANLQDGVFITDIKYLGSSNEGVENLEILNVLKTTLQSRVSLAQTDKDSSITYSINIYNNTSDTYEFMGINYLEGNKTYDNNDIVYELENLPIGKQLAGGGDITLNINFHYKDNLLVDNNVLNSYLNFSFKKVYFIEYVNIDDDDLPKTVAVGNNLIVDFGSSIPLNLNVYLGSDMLEEYTYVDNVLTVSNVEDSVKIVSALPEPSLLSDENLIPIFWDGDDWRVANLESDWYNYGKQEWANAVVLESGVSLATNDIVDISNDVKAMFVWIPRYEYKIATDDSKEIFINFIAKDKTTPTGGYTIPPAFTFGEDELTGIWVGKFETSVDQTSTCYSSVTSANCNNTNLELYVLPNVYSVREQVISVQYELARNFQSAITSETADSHMMKNTEWAIVSYLSQSAFGKYGNDYYSDSNKEIYVNNSSSLETGKSSGSPNFVDSSEEIYSYEYGFVNNAIVSEKNGVGASTTGNIYGVYDMNGGAYEYVMGYLTTASSTFGATSYYDYADFSTTPDSEYYDNYTSTSLSSACGGECIGHGFSETAGWYNDDASFLTSENPWVMRGGVFDSGSAGGIFSYSGTIGYSGGFATFRLSLVDRT